MNRPWAGARSVAGTPAAAVGQPGNHCEGPLSGSASNLRSRPKAVAAKWPLPGESTIIAAILERPAIEKILTHLGLGPQPPPKAPAREVGPHHAG